MKARKLLIAVATVLLAAWALLRSSVPDVDPPTAEQLSATADRWCEQSPERTVPPEEWPPEVRRLRPDRVRVTPDGVYVELGARFVESWGVFVLRTGSALRPGERTDPSYRLLRGRVYWYEVHG